MKKLLRVLAAALLIAAVVVWAATGASRGWTKTSVPRKTLDAVTGIEGVAYEPRFVPGLDFLAAAAIAAAALAGASFLVRSRNAKPSPNN
jgi:hypothetical protein